MADHFFKSALSTFCLLFVACSAARDSSPGTGAAGGGVEDAGVAREHVADGGEQNDAGSNAGTAGSTLPPGSAADAGAARADAATESSASTARGGAGSGGVSPAAGSGGMNPAAGSGGTTAQPPADPESLDYVAEPQDEAAYIFDQSKVRTYNIRIAAADLETIDAHPSDEKWVPAELEFEGKTYSPIKMRYKGSEGAFRAPCTMDGYDDPKAGKCSIKLGFDQVDENMRFHGLKKLNFHSMNNDPSLLRDRLGYSLFRDNNVAAPRAVHAKLLVNGKLEGLFVAVEQVDGRFTRARFTEGGKGNVYKEAWVSKASEQQLTQSLETNSEVADVMGMLNFQQAVRSSAAATASFIDRGYMMRYLAVDRVIVNDDGALHFYCSPSAPDFAVGNGNYYWYQAEQAKHFWLIPWDLDLAFDGTPWVTVHPEWSAQAECTCVAPASGYSPQMPPSCDALVKHFISWKADYEREVDQFIKGPFSDMRVQEKLGAWITQIEPFVSEADGVLQSPHVDDWKYAVDMLREKIESQRIHRGFAYE